MFKKKLTLNMNLFLTMEPLLSRAPLAQKELVTTSIGRTVLVARSQRAPQAEWLLICNGSSEVRSKKRASVGETTIDSRATIPLVVFFRLKLHWGALALEADAPKENKREKTQSSEHMTLLWAKYPVKCFGVQEHLYVGSDHKYDEHGRPSYAKPNDASC